MSSFQHFQNQAEQKSNKPKFANTSLSLSVLLQYAESAQKQNFEALCRLQPLVKTHRDKVEETSQAMVQTESSLEGGEELPVAYTTALALVKDSFADYLGSLDEWMSVLVEKKESLSEKVLRQVKQSAEQLETSLKGLTVPE